jgi:hypothetical protein
VSTYLVNDERDIVINVRRSLCKVPVIVNSILTSLESGGQILVKKKKKDPNFTKVPSSGGKKLTDVTKINSRFYYDYSC